MSRKHLFIPTKQFLVGPASHPASYPPPRRAMHFTVRGKHHLLIHFWIDSGSRHELNIKPGWLEIDEQYLETRERIENADPELPFQDSTNLMKKEITENS